MILILEILQTLGIALCFLTLRTVTQNQMKVGHAIENRLAIIRELIKALPKD